MVDRGFVDYVVFTVLGGLGLYNVILAVRLYKLYGEMHEKYKASIKELAECKRKLQEIEND